MLTGKTALVTGSSQGIGLGVAQAFAANGARVVLTSERPLADVPRRAAAPGDYAHTRYVAGRSAQDGEPERLVAEAWDRARRHRRAREQRRHVTTNRRSRDLTRDHFDFVFRLNVWVGHRGRRGRWCGGRAAAKRGGRILFTTSLNGSRSEPLHTLYDASKGAVNALTRQLAVELAPPASRPRRSPRAWSKRR